MIEFNSEGIYFENNTLNIKRDAQASYNVYIKYEVAKSPVYIPFNSYICAFDLPESLQPL